MALKKSHTEHGRKGRNPTTTHWSCSVFVLWEVNLLCRYMQCHGRVDSAVCTSHWNGCNCQGGLFRSDQHRHWGYTAAVSWPVILPVAQSTWLLHTPCFWRWSPEVQGLLMWLKDGVRVCGWWFSIPWRPCQHHVWISRGFLSSLSQQPFTTVEKQDPSRVTDIQICLCKPSFVMGHT